MDHELRPTPPPTGYAPTAPSSPSPGGTDGGGAPVPPTRWNRQLNMLGLGPLATYVERAVQDALNANLRELPEHLARQVAADARREVLVHVRRASRRIRGIDKDDYLRQLSQVSEGLVRERNQARSELDALKNRLAQLRRGAPEDRSVERETIDDERLRRDLLRLFAQSGGRPEALRELQSQVLALTMKALRVERERGGGTSREEYQRQLDVFERRIQKLNQSLQQTEEQLLALAKAKQGDDGIASVFRTVQGLDENASDLRLKREMLADIFAANLVLQGRAVQEPAPESDLSDFASAG